MATEKKTVSFNIPALGNFNPKVKIAAAIVAALLVIGGAYGAGSNSGYAKGYAAGFNEGNASGDKAGFERGYWKGAEYGCNWLFDELGAPYLVGEQNPFTTYYFLMGIGDKYASRDNCVVPSDHDKAPYSGGPTESN